MDDIALVRHLDPSEERLARVRERVVGGAVFAAWEQFQSGEAYLALALVDRLIEVQPDAAAAYHRRGRVLQELGHDRRARADLERARRLDPEELEVAVGSGSREEEGR